MNAPINLLRTLKDSKRKPQISQKNMLKNNEEMNKQINNKKEVTDQYYFL